MLLTFKSHRERKDANGKSFLDVECILFTSEPKMTRIRVSIPSSADFDLTTATHPHLMPIIHIYDKMDNAPSD